ncbi:MAG: redox-sensing transcriptional repressor Rex [Lentisphaeria bacterium]
MNNQKTPSQSPITWPTTQRLTEYLIILEELAENDIEVVSSRQLAQLYGNTASQVRQDFFRLKHTGNATRGYNIAELQATIRRNLGLDEVHKVAIIGCGKLGSTLALHVPLADYGMRLVAAFDIDPDIIGSRLSGVQVENADKMIKICHDRQVQLAALSVPKTAAQHCADRLVMAGVRGILNYTRVRLRVPAHIRVQNRQIICSFMQLCSRACT